MARGYCCEFCGARYPGQPPVHIPYLLIPLPRKCIECKRRGRYWTVERSISLAACAGIATAIFLITSHLPI